MRSADVVVVVIRREYEESSPPTRSSDGLDGPMVFQALHRLADR